MSSELWIFRSLEKQLITFAMHDVLHTCKPNTIHGKELSLGLETMSKLAELPHKHPL